MPDDRICPNPGSSNETKKIHISTCFIENYQPLARFERGMEVSLADIVGQGIGKKDRLDWIPKGLEEYIETDLFDISQIPYILHHCTAHDHPEGTKNQLERLGFLAGVRTYPSFIGYRPGLNSMHYYRRRCPSNIAAQLVPQATLPID